MDPILFVHGFGASKIQYRPIIKYLKKKGINDFYEFEYGKKYGQVEIKKIAKELSEYIKENIKEPDVNIIAISQGGIIALAYLKFYKNINVKKLFTLCTPHKGSLLAYLASFPGFIDLRPNSNLLKELEAFAENGQTDVYSVYTPLDLMILPGWNAKPKYGTTKIIWAPAHPVAFFWPSSKKFIYKNLI